MDDLRDKTVLLIIAPIEFRDEEYYEPKKYFESQHAKVVTACSSQEAISKAGKKQKADMLLSDVIPDGFSAVVFVGGAGARKYFDDPQALRIAKEFYAIGKIVAAICIAPVILGNAGLLDKRKVTAYPTVEDQLRAKDANYTGVMVETDERIITANGPEAAWGFAEKIAEAILKYVPE